MRSSGVACSSYQKRIEDSSNNVCFNTLIISQREKHINYVSSIIILKIIELTDPMHCVINLIDLYKIKTLQIFIVSIVNGNSMLSNEFSYSKSVVRYLSKRSIQDTEKSTQDSRV